jgi:hypothetical protein
MLCEFTPHGSETKLHQKSKNQASSEKQFSMGSTTMIKVRIQITEFGASAEHLTVVLSSFSSVTVHAEL